MTGISKAEKLARAVDNVRSGGRSFDRQLAAQISKELRAQAARIAELEAQDARIFSEPMIDALMSDVERLKAENGILRTEKHADAEDIGALLSALTEIRDWRKSCHDHDKDMGHDPREFDVEDLKMLEFRASAAIKGVTNV